MSYPFSAEPTRFRFSPLKKWAATSLLIFSAGMAFAEDKAVQASFRLHLDQIEARSDRHRLLGTNLAMWHEPEDLFHENTVKAIQAISASFLRIPGGSWSNEIYWNGNGVRNGDSFDHSKRVQGVWQIDYTDYAPGFRIKSLDGELSDYHGVVDVKQLHEKVRAMGAETVVSVNAGSGSAGMAAEWVRWANLKQRYGVTYWEIGNELEGAWELGHRKEDGSPLTGKEYAERFRHFAKAMKAVDPNIKIGGPVASNLDGGFMEDLLRYAGEHVDFVSVHSYPVGKGFGDERAFFAALSTLQPALKTYRDWIQKYQPERADQIGVALTEWNSKVFEDRDTGDLLNGLWTAAWIGEMLQGGLLFATQWDLMTRTETGGHGLMARNDQGWAPTSQYWATYLWAQHMGNDWIPVSLFGKTALLHLTATRDDRGIHVLAVNFNRDRRISLALPPELAGWEGPVTSTTLSHANYFWDYTEHKPLWSEAPRRARQPLSARVSVPAFSARVFSFHQQPLEASAKELPHGSQRKQAPHILLPEQAAADLPVEGWIFSGSPVATGTQALTVSGPATLKQTAIRIEEGAGRFTLIPNGTGIVTVRAGMLSQQIEIKELEARDELLWSFEDELVNWNLKSSFALSADPVERPNQGVARIDLKGDLPVANKDLLLGTTQLPESLEPERIAGVVVDLKIAPGMISPQDKSFVQVVLQSKADHWIPLGSVSFKKLEDSWQRIRIPLPSTELIPLMKGTYALRLQLQQTQAVKQPVTGTLFVDNLGFIYR